MIMTVVILVVIGAIVLSATGKLKLGKVGDFFGAKANTFIDSNMSDIEKLRVQLGKIKKAREAVEKSYYEYVGKVKFFEEEIDKANKKKDELIDAAKICKGRGDEVKMHRCFTEKKNLESKIDIAQQSLDVAKELEDKTYKQMNDLLSKESTMETQIDNLKMKSDYVKDVEEYGKVMSVHKDVDMTEYDEVVKDIKIKFNGTEKKFEDMVEANEDVLDGVLSDKEYEEFVAQLGQE